MNGMREEVGALVKIGDGRQGICVSAYPDFKAGKGLVLDIAIGATTAMQVETYDFSCRVKVNSENVLCIHGAGR